jgi:transcriptional regulator with XRE-family HTH domain
VSKRKSSQLITRLGQNIAKSRKNLGLTQDQLAEAVAVDPETIGRFERGATAPSLGRLEVIAKRLGVSISALLDEEEQTPMDEALLISGLIAGMKSKDKQFLIEFIQLYRFRHG